METDRNLLFDKQFRTEGANFYKFRERSERISVIAYFLVFFGALLRLIPHVPNFAPIAAIALFGGVYLSRKNALWVPLLAMVLSDFFIGFDSLESRLTVYGSFVLIGLVGLVVRKKKNIATILGGTLAGSILFYLIT